MTIEEKAKRYDGNYKAYTELINRLEDVKEAIKKQNYGIAMDILCKPYPEFQITAFPELKESEGEKIRKALKEYFISSFQNNGVAAICGVHIKDILAWLERQGEQIIDNSARTCKDEQKPWSEEDEKMKNQLIDFMLSGIDISKAPYGCVAWLKSLRERYTWKPSAEQMERLKGTINSLPHQEVLFSLYQDLKKLRRG